MRKLLSLKKKNISKCLEKQKKLNKAFTPIFLIGFLSICLLLVFTNIPSEILIFALFINNCILGYIEKNIKLLKIDEMLNKKEVDVEKLKAIIYNTKNAEASYYKWFILGRIYSFFYILLWIAPILFLATFFMGNFSIEGLLLVICIICLNHMTFKGISERKKFLKAYLLLGK